MAAKNRIELARENVDAWTAGDWKRLNACLAPNVLYDEVGTNRRLDGAIELVEAYKEWKQAGPDGTGTVTNAIDDGKTVVLEVTWKATQTGPLDMPGGAFPPSGKRWEVRGVQVITLEGDKIKVLRQYFDLMTILQQVGAMTAHVG